MKYRQWKKNYKKRYGVNPPASIDKRKQRKAAARAIKALAKVDFMESIGRAAEKIVEIMQQDNLEHIRLNEPERIQKRQDAADSLRAAVITAYEKEVVENG